MNIKKKIGYLYKKLNTNQSGQKDLWILDFSQNDEQYIEPIMSLTGSRNSNSQIRMTFANKENAKNFAKQNNFFIIEGFNSNDENHAFPKKIKPKNYTKNFS